MLTLQVLTETMLLLLSIYIIRISCVHEPLNFVSVVQPISASIKVVLTQLSGYLVL